MRAGFLGVITARVLSVGARDLLQLSPNPSGRAGRATEEPTPLHLPCAGGTEGGKGGIMEGRYPHGLLLAITNCTDPSKEEEFNA